MAGLACHTFGVNVVRALAQVPGLGQQVKSELSQKEKRVSRDKFGRLLLRELGLAKAEATAEIALSAVVGGA